MNHNNTKHGFLIVLYLCLSSALLGQERISFDLQGYKYGFIQWQQSADGELWSDLVDETQPTLEVTDEAPLFYRAKVTDGTCLPWYSSVYVPTVDPYSMVKVAGGDFIMGVMATDLEAYSDEQRTHKVTLESYYISKYEITNIQFVAFLNQKQIGVDGTVPTSDFGLQTVCYTLDPLSQLEYVAGKWSPKAGYEHYPVVNVTWYGASEFCKWAGGRLPSEAEWEFAARGGTQSLNSLFSGSKTVEEVAWTHSNAESKTHSVGQKRANELGLFDLSGNVWEWCSDWYGSYPLDDQHNPTGAAAGLYRVFRGGSVYTLPNLNRNTLRYYGDPTHYYNSLGFRLVKTTL